MTRDRKRGGHGFREGVLQALYLMVGLVIAFPIIYAFFISFMEPSQVLACEPDSEEMDSGEL